MCIQACLDVSPWPDQQQNSRLCVLGFVIWACSDLGCWTALLSDWAFEVKVVGQRHRVIGATLKP